MEQDDTEDKDLSDAEFNSEDEGDDIDLDTPIPLHGITFEINTDINITSQALRDMVATEHSVQMSAAPQPSAPTKACNDQEKVAAQPDWNW